MAADQYLIVARSNAIDGLEDISSSIRTNIVRAINKTTQWSRAESARRMREQVNFGASYLSGAGGRLTITQQATSNDLSAVITGRHRATSLARFASNAREGYQRGARITVQPGLSKFLPRAFFVPLRSGNSDTKNNVGLAIRLPAGKIPSKAFKPTPLSRNTWLLYGPSVDQVFDDVAMEISPEAAERLESEFFRLMELDI